MKVFVVMGNDYPSAVFEDEAKAEAYCKEMKAESKKGKPASYPGIYYRVYEFEVRK